MSVINSAEPVKGYASVAPKLSINLNWVTPLENKKFLVKLAYLVATLNLFFFLSLNSNAISSKSAIVWTSIQGSGIATTKLAFPKLSFLITFIFFWVFISLSFNKSKPEKPISIDIGFSGFDLLKESEINTQKKINVIKKLNFGKANLVVAIPDPWIDVQTIADLEEIAFEFRDKKKKRLRVATKYANLTRNFLFSKGVTQFKLIDSLGATEAYPFTGSAELITDISSSGETLRANNLRVLKDGEILKSQACIFTSKKNSKKKGLKNLIRLLSK